MCEEKWVIWNPREIFSEDYYDISDLSYYGEKGFKLIFTAHEDNKKIVEMSFLGNVSFRCTNELYMSDYQKNCTSEKALAYKIINSNYIKWLTSISESLNTIIQPNLEHYIFVASDDYIEVLSSWEPVITCSNQNN